MDEKERDEYEQFIRVTREHQKERERLKKLELKKKKVELEAEEYYTDISQVNTLIEDNLVPVPEKKKLWSKESKEASLVEQYGGREPYERIRSMEMSIDEHFRNECQQLKPPFWPVIPINLKPYLNPQR